MQWYMWYMLLIEQAAIHIENPLPDVIFKSITLTTVHGRRIFHTWEQCEKLINEQKVPLDVF